MSKFLLRLIAPSFLFSLLTTAGAQRHEYFNPELAVSVAGQFTSTITTDAPGNYVQTTDSGALLFTARNYMPKHFAVEANYEHTRLSERYTNPTLGSAPNLNVGLHEASLGFLYHRSYRRLQPFVGLGGGALSFRPGDRDHQSRGAGLLEAGVDAATGLPHLGLRLQVRALFYNSPDFGLPALDAGRWVATTEPAFGAYYRF